MKSVFIFVGTRPEALKLLPVCLELRRNRNLNVRLISTGQHREMLRSVLNFFETRADIDFDLMLPNQSLGDLTAAILLETTKLLSRESPALIIVQGDTTTCFAVSLAAFYLGIPVAHVEAGLRSHDLDAPFPEEANRRITSLLARYHFAPTKSAVAELKREKVRGKIVLTGNTVIDCLLMAVRKIRNEKNGFGNRLIERMGARKRMVLITCHRRENFGEPFGRICAAIERLSRRFSDILFVYPVHPNPNILEAAKTRLGGLENVWLIEPVPYGEMVYLMTRSSLILTDSGGLQEEAPTLGKPVIVLREVTERPEGLKAGSAVLAGTRTAKIVSLATRLLTDKKMYQRMARAGNPYGDGKSAKRIGAVVARELA